MLISTRHAYGAVLEGPDGRLGALYDILFDDQSWKVRHLLVSRDRWFHGRQALVEPEVVERTDWAERKLSVRMTKEQIERCPGPETDLPVARRQAREAAQVLVWEGLLDGRAGRFRGGGGGGFAPAEHQGPQRNAHPLHRRHVRPRRRLHLRRRNLDDPPPGGRDAELVAGQARAGRARFDPLDPLGGRGNLPLADAGGGRSTARRTRGPCPSNKRWSRAAEPAGRGNPELYQEDRHSCLSFTDRQECLSSWNGTS